MLDDELMDEEDELTDELEDVLEDVVALAVVDAVLDEVPGMVYALTVPSRPTPATALKATPAVSRLSRRIAASRACILRCVVGSMVGESAASL